MPNGHESEPQQNRAYEYGKDWDECRMSVLRDLDRNEREHATLFKMCRDNAVGLAKLMGMCAASAAAGGLIFKVGENVLTGG